MFQPTNESYIRSLVESTIDRHMGESEFERVMRQERPFQETQASNRARGLLVAVGLVFRSIGEQLGKVRTRDKIMSHRQIVSQ